MANHDSARLDIRLIDFHGHRSHDQLQRKDYSKSIFSADQDALRTGQRTVFHSHATPNCQIRVRLRADSASQPSHQRIHLALRQWQRMAVEAHKSYYARQSQNLQTVLQGNAHEDITREQCQFQFFPTVFPTPYRPVERQEARDAVLLDLLHYALFVSRTGI